MWHVGDTLLLENFKAVSVRLVATKIPRGQYILRGHKLRDDRFADLIIYPHGTFSEHLTVFPSPYQLFSIMRITIREQHSQHFIMKLLCHPLCYAISYEGTQLSLVACEPVSWRELPLATRKIRCRFRQQNESKTTSNIRVHPTCQLPPLRYGWLFNGTFP